jgi:hypothetical protein
VNHTLTRQPRRPAADAFAHAPARGRLRAVSNDRNDDRNESTATNRPHGEIDRTESRTEAASPTARHCPRVRPGRAAGAPPPVAEPSPAAIRLLRHLT